MRKIKLLRFCCLLFTVYGLLFTVYGLLFTVFACQKRSKLIADTLVIAVEPSSPQIVAPGAELSLEAFCRNSATNNADISPEWTVQNNLGSFSKATGKRTVFTAGNSAGSGKVFVSYQGMTGELAVTVGSAINTIYGLYSDTYTSPLYAALKFDTPNPGDVNGGCMGAWDGATISAGTTAGQYTEGSQGLKCGIGAIPGGWWMQFGSNNTAGYNSDAKVPTDMSSYSGGNIKFDAKTSKEITIKVEWTGGSKELRLNADLSMPLDNDWHSITVPLTNFTGIDLANITIPAGFHTTNTIFVYYIDNVRWEK